MLLLVSAMCASAKINLEGLGLTSAQIKAINERMQPQWRQFRGLFVVFFGLARSGNDHVSTFVEPKGQVCRALALSGGGDRIAYQAGVGRTYQPIWNGKIKILRLCHLQVVSGLLMGGANVQYNVVSGVSTGAIFASALRLFPIGLFCNMHVVALIGTGTLSQRV